MARIVGRSYDPAASRWLEVVRRYTYATGPIITKLESRAFWLASEFVKQAREEIGLSQRGLATAAGISNSVIANWEADAKVAGLESTIRLYGVLEERGSRLARKALLAITKTDKEISLATLRLIEAEAQTVKVHLEKCEAEIQRLSRKD